MKSPTFVTRLMVLAAVFLGGYLFLAGIARAHCDTPSGPVIPEAQAALEKGELTPVLKWIRKEDEDEIKTAFGRALAVRALNPEAKELADRYFIETLVRVHRAGEGAPYTGIKDEPIEPIVALADRALAEGSSEAMIKKISGHLAETIRRKFDRALRAGKDKDKTVAAGREFVEAYVDYVHYVESIHSAIMSDAGHHHAGGAESAPPAGGKHQENQD